jgi:hypothetical protein
MKRSIALLGMALSLGFMGAVASTSQATPPGNNGTIKIDGVLFDDHPNNEPHPGCSFQVDFYGFDQGDLSASMTFRGIPPTGGGTLYSGEVFIGEDPAGGGRDLDASATIDLSQALGGIEPHPKQGYHVKLTIHAEGSQGADVKHKVFWVTECIGSGPGGGGGGGGGGGAGGGGGGAGPAGPATAVEAVPAFTG